MPRDLLTVTLCELAEQILAMREVLTEPAVATKPHARAVATLLGRGLDAVEGHLQRAAIVPDSDDPAAALRSLDACGRALRGLHRRLGLLDKRWDTAPIDIFLRQLREDAGGLPHPAVVLSDSFDALDDDVAGALRHDLDATGIAAGAAWHGQAVIAVPRLVATNPLAWPLVLPALVRLRGDTAQDPAAAAVCLGGPAVFAAQAAQALIMTPAGTPVWPALSRLAATAQRYAIHPAGDQGIGDDALAASEPVSLFVHLALSRDSALGFERAPHAHEGADAHPVSSAGAPLPSPSEAAALLAKLAAGVPINAVDPPLPPDFVQRLDAVDDPAGLYDLLEPLGERPATLPAILGVGWLYKVRYSYPYFREALRSGPTLRAALDAYRPHMIERTELLLQSIEAAHVQGIFLRGRLEP